MHSKKIDNLLKMSGKKRSMYFVRKVSDFEELWGLYDEGWAMVADETGRNAIAFWPEKELAETCARNSWSDYQAKSIKLYNFIENWIPGMISEGLAVVIFPTPYNKGVILSPLELNKFIKGELDKY